MINQFTILGKVSSPLTVGSDGNCRFSVGVLDNPDDPRSAYGYYPVVISSNNKEMIDYCLEHLKENDLGLISGRLSTTSMNVEDTKIFTVNLICDSIQAISGETDSDLLNSEIEDAMTSLEDSPEVRYSDDYVDDIDV